MFSQLLLSDLTVFCACSPVRSTISSCDPWQFLLCRVKRFDHSPGLFGIFLFTCSHSLFIMDLKSVIDDNISPRLVLLTLYRVSFVRSVQCF